MTYQSDITTIYISGPMNGYPNLNQEAFRRIAKVITDRGFTAVIPHDIEAYPHAGECPVSYVDKTGEPRTTEHSAACYLRADLRVMLTCDVVLLMDNWHMSVGARVEHRVAVTCGIPTISVALFVNGAVSLRGAQLEAGRQYSVTSNALHPQAVLHAEPGMNSHSER